MAVLADFGLTQVEHASVLAALAARRQLTVTSRGSISLIDPRSTTSASSSISVGSPFTITMRAPARFAIGTMPATG